MSPGHKRTGLGGPGNWSLSGIPGLETLISRTGVRIRVRGTEGQGGTSLVLFSKTGPKGDETDGGLVGTTKEYTGTYRPTQRTKIPRHSSCLNKYP